MTISIHPRDPLLTWSGAISLRQDEGGVSPWRLPVDRLALYPFEELHHRAAMPAGVRISFRSDTSFLAFAFDGIPAESSARVDLCVNNDLHASVALTGRDRLEFRDLPPGEKLLELWLPQNHRFRLTGLELAEGASLHRHRDERPLWITYGSSITQCEEAPSPTRTWPALVARDAGLNLTCLGYSGQCHIEPMLARLIRDQPADLISLCLGINVHSGSLNLRTFRPAVIGAISIVRESHVRTPLAVVSPIFSPDRESRPNQVDMTLRIMRAEIGAAVATLQDLGDDNLYYVDGLTLLGEDEVHLLPDRLHPSPEGYELMARRFLSEVLPLLGYGDSHSSKAMT